MQHASIAAWNDEASVRDNRDRYREKVAAFYVWARVPGDDDERFARDLFRATHVTVLPGRYLAREAHGVNPGRGYVRMALVADVGDCVEGARRIVEFCR